ncbi:efflux RND transporter periplasmic adaptor subunit [Chryseolinea lacunae]|uniref:HlyD family efflux transporter periplasmic adaptor subunit n=1 Tax=Chryseolinea lacunae TaxID=2801331 RepID=A0ABS1L309_9BACT|nr:HlyD family efflux transporter periplasmic adaptor subunit [Chryseolinea lacunae]MBL0745887.1 HlyD family efflux transporter periplasmic adaptor subunit [Chryseolinea lacunae]
MKNYLVPILPLVVLFCNSCKEKDTWVTPREAPITEAIFATGHLEPVGQRVLTSFTEGYLRHAFVKESDVAANGAVLFTLDNSSKAIEEDAAEKNLQLTVQNTSPQSPVLQKLRIDLKTAQQKRALDSLQYARLNRLFETKSVAQVDLDKAKLEYELDVNNEKSIRENIEATQLNLQQSLVQAQSQYQSSSVGNHYYTLRSPDWLRVYQVFKKPGELVRKGDAVALLGHPDSLIVMLFVDEGSISKIKLGQRVLIELNTAKGKSYQAKVSRIYPYFDTETQSFRVEASVDELLPGSIAGTLLQGDIIVNHKAKTLLMPRPCLGPNGEVVVLRRNVRDTITPETGIISTEWVEVISGVTPEDKILKPF